MRRAVVLGCALVLVAALPAWAQGDAPFTIRGFADGGVRTFTAKESFETILGSAFGPFVGGGIELVERHGVFGSVRASWFRRTGERVFRFNGRTFPLGIPATITIIPLELTGGYRVDRGWRVVPYGGGGVGWHRSEETSEHSTPAESVKETFVGYHVLGGAEAQIWKWVSAAGEVQWSTVPDALGRDSSGVAGEFGEDDLGGFSIRAKVIIGRR